MPAAVHEEIRLRRSPGLTVLLSYDPEAAAKPRFAALVFPPHPELGGDREHPLLRELVERVIFAGGCALRLEYPRARPETQRPEGPVLPESRLRELLLPWREAVEIAGRIAPGAPVFGFGYSLGAQLAAMAAAEGGLARTVLAAPPLARQGVPPIRPCSGRVLVLVGDDDFACPVDLLAALPGTKEGAFEVRVVGGSDHFFRGDEAHVAGLVLAHWGV